MILLRQVRFGRENLSKNDKICNTVEVKNNQTGNLSVTSNPFWSLESSGHLSEEGLHEICLISDRGVGNL